jgi:hypothetical protein
LVPQVIKQIIHLSNMSKVQETNFFPNFWHNLWKVVINILLFYIFNWLEIAWQWTDAKQWVMRNKPEKEQKEKWIKKEKI